MWVSGQQLQLVRADVRHAANLCNADVCCYISGFPGVCDATYLSGPNCRRYLQYVWPPLCRYTSVCKYCFGADLGDRPFLDNSCVGCAQPSCTKHSRVLQPASLWLCVSVAVSRWEGSLTCGLTAISMWHTLFGNSLLLPRMGNNNGIHASAALSCAQGQDHLHVMYAARHTM